MDAEARTRDALANIAQLELGNQGSHEERISKLAIRMIPDLKEPCKKHTTSSVSRAVSWQLGTYCGKLSVTHDTNVGKQARNRQPLLRHSRISSISEAIAQPCSGQLFQQCTTSHSFDSDARHHQVQAGNTGVRRNTWRQSWKLSLVRLPDPQL